MDTARAARVLGARAALLLLCLLSGCTSDLDRFKIGGTGGSHSHKTPDAGAAGSAGDASTPRDADIDAGHDARDGAGPSASDAGTKDAASDASEPPACEEQVVYADADRDGHGDVSSAARGCPSDDLVTSSDDCDDHDRSRHPGAPELCNGIDDNCDHTVDEGCACGVDETRPCGATDSMGKILVEGECRAGKQACVGGLWADCNGARGPVPETCNGNDDDCDGRTDEGTLMRLFSDEDGDGYGRAQAADGCRVDTGLSDKGGDCDDGNEDAYPGAPERCDGVNRSDCNAATDPHCPTMLPSAPSSCPTLATGSTVVFGLNVSLTIGTRSTAQQAPILIHFHALGSTAGEPTFLLSGLSEISAQGGVVISPISSTQIGTPIDNTQTWYLGDFDAIDQLVACAIRQQNIDTRRIYVSGLNAGASAAATFAYLRSGYVADLLAAAGGFLNPTVPALEDELHPPATFTEHPADGVDVIAGIDYGMASRALAQDVANKYGLVVDCLHSGGITTPPQAVKDAGWQFLKDHPFGVTPDPYAASLPSSFPSGCLVVQFQ